MRSRLVVAIGMLIGLSLGSLIASIFGVGTLSFWSILGGFIGGVVGIYLTARFTSL